MAVNGRRKIGDTSSVAISTSDTKLALWNVSSSSIQRQEAVTG